MSTQEFPNDKLSLAFYYFSMQDLPPKKSIPPIPEVAQRPMSPTMGPTFTVGEATQASRTNLTPSKVRTTPAALSWLWRVWLIPPTFSHWKWRLRSVFYVAVAKVCAWSRHVSPPALLVFCQWVGCLLLITRV